MSGWRRAGPWRSGVHYSQVCGAATAKADEHVRVARRQDPRIKKKLRMMGSDNVFIAGNGV